MNTFGEPSGYKTADRNVSEEEKSNRRQTVRHLNRSSMSQAMAPKYILLLTILFGLCSFVRGACKPAPAGVACLAASPNNRWQRKCTWNNCRRNYGGKLCYDGSGGCYVQGRSGIFSDGCSQCFCVTGKLSRKAACSKGEYWKRRSNDLWGCLNP
eukprot:gb/GEZJ01003722.1/.p1 GENE.gb/GEZJ01003722.1/~~gb/GEZJ01003722.1/.p1  ORF type:complete len:155 (-),score=7.55 gb/GEZJ01003722.1/:320-784(-)